jgi:hypothetical protein
MASISIPFRVLSESGAFVDEVRNGAGVTQKISSLYLSSFALIAVYGGVMGGYNGLAQALSSAIKLPLLFLLTAAICFPTLYVGLLLLGVRVRGSQLFALVVSSTGVSSMLLLAFAPVTAFFLLTSADYTFYKLLNVTILALAAVMGARFLFRSLREIVPSDTQSVAHRALLSWIVLYAFVGTQLGWTLRPFFGAPNLKFEVVREVGGNFYSDVAQSVGELFQIPD